jgi:predicted alpha/beta-fold hydrolase
MSLDPPLGEKSQRFPRVRAFSNPEHLHFHSACSPAWWLRGPHLQTLWGKFCRRAPVQDTSLERLDTPDGDFIELHHLDGRAGAPLLVLLHGLEGSIRSHYIQGLLGQARARGWRAAVLIWRSCGRELNRARRFYHSGETADLAFALDHLSTKFTGVPIVLAGASLGGNVLLKFLGEQEDRISPRIQGAVAVSVPFDLSRSSRHIDKGFARVYQRHFLRSLKRKAMAKLDRYPDLFSEERLSRARTMFDFDDCFTAPVHGFTGAEDYYSRSSSLRWLDRIRVKTLLLSAVDDPFLPAQVLDEVLDTARRNPALVPELARGGGHVGFVAGRNPFRPVYYLEQRTGDFLADQLAAADGSRR